MPVKPKPTKLKILEGNPGKRPLNLNEPIPIQVDLKCPNWLLAEAKKEWKRLAPELERIGLLTIVDTVAFAGYCQSYAKWKLAEEFIKKNGTTYRIPRRNKEGKITSVYIAQFPEVAIARNSLRQIRMFAQEFGLTPSSRGRLFLPSEIIDDEFEALLD